MSTLAIKDLLYRMADDALIIGHRNSEWTGIGPMLEEDLAFSSMAQDKVGHAWALYTILHEVLGEPVPDRVAFLREEKEYKCCHLVELPIGEYDFSLIRHFLFDHAESLRYDALATSSFEPLARVARKVKGEIKYHVMHADTFLRQLSAGNETSRARMQTALNEAMPYALGIFEGGVDEAHLITDGVFIGEVALQALWVDKITKIITDSGLTMPTIDMSKASLGGRKGYHTEYLKPLLDEMSEVVRLDPQAEW